MSTAKHDVEELLKRLPDDVSFEDLQYHLYVLEKIRRGRDDADGGRVSSQEDFERQFSKWLDE